MLNSFAALLTYGALGLASILAFLTFRLLQQESKKPVPNAEMLKATNKFMYGSVLLAIVCGVLAIADTFVKNSTASGVVVKEEEIKQLSGEIAKLKKIEESFNFLQTEVTSLRLKDSKYQEALKMMQKVLRLKSVVTEQYGGEPAVKESIAALQKTIEELIGASQDGQ